MNAQNFIVLNNGHVLLQGYFDENAPREQRGRGYLGEFDSSGKLLRKSFGKVSEEVLKDVATRAADAAAGQSEDGMTYLLEPDKVVVISQAGEVVKNLPLRIPAPGYRAYNLYVAGRRLVVGFYKIADRGHQIVARYALLDPSTGEQLRLYQPSAELVGTMVCFSNEGFTFYSVDHRRVKLLTAAAN